MAGRLPREQWHPIDFAALPEHAVDLPFTEEQAAQAARVLDEIRARVARNASKKGES